MNPIGSINVLQGSPLQRTDAPLPKIGLTQATPNIAAPSEGFGTMLDGLVGTVESKQAAAQAATRKVLLGDWSSPLAPLLLDQAWVFRLVALLSLIMEVGAPVALLGGRVAAGWAILAYAFHLGVVVLMMIFFPYQVLGVAYLPFFPAERPVGAVGRFLVRRWNGQRSSV